MKFEVLVESIGVFGSSGSGKTTLIQNLIKRYFNIKRIIVLAVKDEYQDLRFRYLAQSLTIEELNRFSKAVSVLRGWTILIEDLYAFTSGYGRGDELEKLAVVWSRENKLRLIYASQRVISTPRAWLTKTDMFFIGTGLPPQDLRYLADFVGFDPQEVPKEPYHFLVICPRLGLKGIIKNDFTG